MEVTYPETKFVEELVATNTVVEKRYADTGRFTVRSVDNGDDVDYTLTITSRSN